MRPSQRPIKPLHWGESSCTAARRWARRLSHKSNLVVRITALDAENYGVVWCTHGCPKFILSTESWQALSEVEGGKTKYEIIEVFRGPLAYVVKFLL